MDEHAPRKNRNEKKKERNYPTLRVRHDRIPPVREVERERIRMKERLGRSWARKRKNGQNNPELLPK